MHELLLYLFKAGISLGAVVLFYHLILRRMTFYVWNRWYLLGYSALALLLPLINVGPWLQQKEWQSEKLMEWIPPLGALPKNSTPVAASTSSWEPLTVVLLVFAAGVLIGTVRFLIQLWSFYRLRHQATLIQGEGTRLYQVNKPILPFSFGNAIYVNMEQHSEEELKEIIRHEFVHIRQKHTLDMVWSEWLCILNWYNPFAWWLRKAIRQNLEFIADRHVMESGVDRKQYQYLLLKVMGQQAWQVAPGFNFSSLKTRIAMMNKIKTQKVHLIKFLFAPPLAMLLLIVFRSEEVLAQTAPVIKEERVKAPAKVNAPAPAEAPAIREEPAAAPDAPARYDTLPPRVIKPNGKGYILTIADNEGECVVIIKDRSKKIIKAMLLTEWTANEKENIAKYGEIQPPPPPPAKKVEERQLDKAVVRVKKNGVESDEVVYITADKVVVGNPDQKKEKPSTLVLKKGESSPVYVLDGVVVESQEIELVDPSDIESIHVLKGENATSKYGEKAKHGAVEIKIKKKTN